MNITSTTTAPLCATPAERPLPTKYGMFSKAGDARVLAIVRGALRLPMSTSNEKLYAFLSKRMNAVGDKYGEVWDTAVRESLIGVIESRTGRDLSIYF